MNKQEMRTELWYWNLVWNYLPEKLKMSLDVDGTDIGLYLLTNLGIGSFWGFHSGAVEIFLWCCAASLHDWCPTMGTVWWSHLQWRSV